MERAATLISRATLFATPVVLLVLFLGLGPSSFKEASVAMGWFLRHQLTANVPFMIALVATAMGLSAWCIVALRARSRYARALAAGAVPERRVGVIADEELARLAREALAPELARIRPRVERVLDALMGALVDLGAAQVSMIPGTDAAADVEVTMRVAMGRIPLLSISRGLHDQLVERLRLIIGVDDFGEGAVELRSGDAVEYLDVRLTQAANGPEVRLGVTRREGISRALEDLGMPRDVFEATDHALGRDKGLVLVVGEASSGRSNTLYAMAHRLYLAHGKRQEAVVALEERVRMAVPFMVQVEVGDARPDAVFSAMVETPHDVFVVRDMDTDPALVARVLAAARDHLVLASVEAAGPIDAVMRLDRMCPDAQVSVADVFLFGVGQQMFPRLCECRLPLPAADPAREFLAELLPDHDGGTFLQANGCERCQRLGFSSQHFGLFWGVRPEPWLIEALKAGRPGAELQQLAIEHGVVPFRGAALAAARGEIDARDVVALAERRW